ncbi:MAG: hypothetical protein A2729_00650 [Candidatus Buchananbacteria bacterium RIFCSPHIGHO2_01_FULL_39_14]|uniref:Uncharacterized protein n=2 Tax=Candidatus Buchananiibacteriota TaxID=1817903 RepID=A0A1G1YSB8_9BACT|nr:MAG: hypothetical protein A2729_00650 [Candidatus Buchananbacteria bacterium RIFCSPHIGHO2_01_FULL_39_14]OGY48695.1 MAG: hypothetical protein A3D39_04455 [Candidatus Buchananbacteria bacterium RIFCSPHIGHO2_02_FULL_39_17]OGY54530.1 MAG: hypothetical protein A2912_00260 [Candidatus Buchananbacteria bacterium RIFCSPLOWO2_01_FULL_40_23b]
MQGVNILFWSKNHKIEFPRPKIPEYFAHRQAVFLNFLIRLPKVRIGNTQKRQVSPTSIDKID